MEKRVLLSKNIIIFILAITIIIIAVGVVLILLGLNMTFSELFYNNAITTQIFSAIYFLGDEFGLIILVIAVIFAYDTKYGKNLAISLLFSIYFNGILKDIFQNPLPWTRADQNGFGFPSGHAQNAVATCGYMAGEAYQKESKILPWIFLSIIYLIAVSRIMVGANDIDDVVGGLLFGITFLVLYIYFEPMISERINALDLKIKLIVAIVVPIAFSVIAVTIFSNSYNHYGLVGGALMGLSIGYLIESEKIRYDPGKLKTKWRLANLIIGIFATVLVYLILSFIPLDGQFWEFLEYFIISLVAILLVPWVFTKIDR